MQECFQATNALAYYCLTYKLKYFAVQGPEESVYEYSNAKCLQCSK